MGTHTGQEGTREAQVGPKSGQKKRDPKFNAFLPLLGPVLKAFSCSRRSSEAFGRGSFFGYLFGTLLGTAGRVKVAILYGTSAKNTASDLKDKRLKTVPKSTPKIIKKRVGRRLLGCRNQDPQKLRKQIQKVKILLGGGESQRAEWAEPLEPL